MLITSLVVKPRGIDCILECEGVWLPSIDLLSSATQERNKKGYQRHLKTIGKSPWQAFKGLSRQSGPSHYSWACVLHKVTAVAMSGAWCGLWGCEIMQRPKARRSDVSQNIKGRNANTPHKPRVDSNIGSLKCEMEGDSLHSTGCPLQMRFRFPAMIMSFEICCMR